MQPTQQQIKEILSKVIYPQFSEDIISYGFVKNISIDEKGSPTITLHIPSRDELVAKALRDNIERKLEEAGIKSSQIYINTPATKVDSASQNPQIPQNFSQNPHNSKNPQSMQNSQNPLQKNILPQAKSFVMVS